MARSLTLSLKNISPRTEKSEFSNFVKVIISWSIDNWIIDGILRQPFGADLHFSIHTSMLINVNESIVSFMNNDIIDISIGSVNPDSFSLKRLLEYSVNSPVVYGIGIAKVVLNTRLGSKGKYESCCF